MKSYNQQNVLNKLIYSYNKNALSSVQWNKFKVKRPSTYFKYITFQVRVNKWYHKVFDFIKNFFKEDISPMKIRALRAFYDAKKLDAVRPVCRRLQYDVIKRHVEFRQ